MKPLLAIIVAILLLNQFLVKPQAEKEEEIINHLVPSPSMNPELAEAAKNVDADWLASYREAVANGKSQEFIEADKAKRDAEIKAIFDDIKQQELESRLRRIESQLTDLSTRS